MTAYATNARQLTIWFTLISTAFVFILLQSSRISFEYAESSGFYYLIFVFYGLSIYCWKRKLLRLAPSLEALALGTIMTVPILISTYLAASLDMPLMDAPLVRADAVLGLHWTTFIQFVDAHPTFANVLAVAYSSFGIQLLVLPLILGATGRYARCYTMILSYGVLCYISSFVSIWFPALGTYSTYGVTQDQLQSINAYYGFAFLGDFTAVRQQAEFVLSATDAHGIVTFPSVHAAVAFLCAWATWDLKPLRYFFIAWNVLMGISAVSHANHYLVDIIAGVAVAGFSIYAVSQVLRHMGRTHWSVMSPSVALSLPVRDGHNNSGSPPLPS